MDDRGRYRVSELPPHHFARVDGDALGAMASRAALSAVPWTPDVAAVVTHRLARDAAAYPELFSVGPGTPSPRMPIPAAARLAGKTHRVPRRWGGGMALAVAGLVTAVAVVGAAGFLGVQGPGARTVVAPADLAVVGDDRVTGVVASSPAEADRVVEAGSSATAVAETGSTEVRPPADTGAVVSADEPLLAIVGAPPAAGGRVGAVVEVAAKPVRETDVHWTQLLRKGQGGRWRPVAAAAGARPVLTTLAPDKRYDFRVRTLDEAGNVLSSRRVRAVLTVRQWAAGSIDRTRGDWTTTTGDPRLGGALASKTMDAAITTSFKGDGVALVSPVGPTGGAMRVRVDGGTWVRGDLSDAQPDDQAVVFSRALEDGRHSLDIAVDHGVITLDSVLIVRTPESWPRPS